MSDGANLGAGSRRVRTVSRSLRRESRRSVDGPDEKRELRQLKREIKRAGGKRARLQLKRGLVDAPRGGPRGRARLRPAPLGRPQRDRPRLDPEADESTEGPMADGSMAAVIDRPSDHFLRIGASSVFLARKAASSEPLGRLGGEPFDHGDVLAPALDGVDGPRVGAADRVGEGVGRGDAFAHLGRLEPGVLAGEVAGVVLGVPGR